MADSRKIQEPASLDDGLTRTSVLSFKPPGIDPRRHPNEALAALSQTVGDILQKQPVVQGNSSATHESSALVSSVLLRPLQAQETGPTDQQKEAFLTSSIDRARVQLEAEYQRWHESFLKTQQAVDLAKSSNSAAVNDDDNDRVDESNIERSSSKRKRGDGESNAGPSVTRKRKATAPGHIKSVMRHNGQQTGTAAASHDRNSRAKKTVRFNLNNDNNADNGHDALTTNEPHTSESEVGTMQGTQETKPAQNQSPGPTYTPHREGHGRISPSAPAWDALPHNMKLIVVKELATWYGTDGAFRLLRLTSDQMAHFSTLYRCEKQKQVDYEAAVRREASAEQTDANGPVYRNLYHGRYLFATSVSPPWGAEASRLRPSLLLAPERTPVCAPVLVTDVVTIGDMQAGEAFLRSLGLVPESLDLGHWIGHSGLARFDLEDGNHGHDPCEVGHHGSPTGGLPQVGKEKKPTEAHPHSPWTHKST
ncbi:cytoskeletal adaptor protein [Niveomyces insectorum RCEF 264]|uniref:Cytoskeletal adaptor protein n=1 Tax=Niveomyces insectorum RCEF 264 TaxID=1081102 RepID=A0A167QYK3_9HYPO|nr:cytoskeletal adaptor protein [Niveomyces insectorum RCEF 264]